jgi:hypothetical protein
MLQGLVLSMNLEEHQGLSVEISPEDEGFSSCQISSIGASLLRGDWNHWKGCYHHIIKSENSKWDIY